MDQFLEREQDRGLFELPKRPAARIVELQCRVEYATKFLFSPNVV